MSDELARKIAKKWGWSFEELMEHLEDGGSALSLSNCSAQQTAHAIIKAMLAARRG